jgi:RHS repeat-associated protein
VVAQYTYDAFGNTIAQSGLLANTFRHRYSTKYLDTETSLYYYGYRFYHPTLMRWLNRDPIEEDGGINLYAFCGNDSLYKIDIDGCREWTEETAIQAVKEKIEWMRRQGYNFAADALQHFIDNEQGNIDLSKYASEIYDNLGFQQKFYDVVTTYLQKTDPNGTNKKVKIGDIKYVALMNNDLTFFNFGTDIKEMFNYRFELFNSPSLFYALYGSRYSFCGEASWCKNYRTMGGEFSYKTQIKMNLNVISWDPLTYPLKPVRDWFPSYVASNFMENKFKQTSGYKTRYIYLRWKEKRTWTKSFSSSPHFSYSTLSIK